ncbi:MAG: type II toxin-antitoxin system VapB family antitoxin [Rhizobiaceae bacterium]|nr:type II toxin-antitoxin system VapB family antitoxin [Rhizobiaceae bacterium]
MVIHVKDEKTDALVRRLAESRGIGITSAIKEAVEEALTRDAQADTRAGRGSDDRVRAMLQRWDRLPKTAVVPDKEFFDDLWGE